MSRDSTSWLHRHPIAVYLILSNGITWLCWIPGLLIGSQQGYILPNVDTYATLFQTGFANRQHLILSVAFGLGVYGPLIGALVATWLDRGKEGLVELWGRTKRWHVGARWYLTILLLSFLVLAIPVGIALLAGMTKLSTGSAIALPYAMFLVFAQILTSGLGEEPGWRGFLLPRLRARFDGQKYIWLLGLIWAIWHYPLVVSQTLSMMRDVTPVQTIVAIPFTLAGNAMSLIGFTYLYVWVYNNTRSLFLAILLHALGNVFPVLLLSFVADPQVITPFTGIMPWVLVFILRIALGKERFPGQAVTA